MATPSLVRTVFVLRSRTATVVVPPLVTFVVAGLLTLFFDSSFWVRNHLCGCFWAPTGLLVVAALMLAQGSWVAWQVQVQFADASARVRGSLISLIFLLSVAVGGGAVGLRFVLRGDAPHGAYVLAFDRVRWVEGDCEERWMMMGDVLGRIAPGKSRADLGRLLRAAEGKDGSLRRRVFNVGITELDLVLYFDASGTFSGWSIEVG